MNKLNIESYRDMFEWMGRTLEDKYRIVLYPTFNVFEELVNFDSNTYRTVFKFNTLEECVENISQLMQNGELEILYKSDATYESRNDRVQNDLWYLCAQIFNKLRYQYDVEKSPDGSVSITVQDLKDKLSPAQTYSFPSFSSAVDWLKEQYTAYIKAGGTR